MVAVPNHEKFDWQHFQTFQEFVANFWQQIFFFRKNVAKV